MNKIITILEIWTGKRAAGRELARIVFARYGAGKGGAHRGAGGPGDTVSDLCGSGGGRRGFVVRIARRVAGVFLIVALVLVPMYAGAVSGDTDGPAARISPGAGGTQSRGLEGFFDHNDNGANGWSSWMNKAGAIEDGEKLVGGSGAFTSGVTNDERFGITVSGDGLVTAAKGKGLNITNVNPRTGDDFNPLIAAVILGCTGGLTLVMLIRRSRI
jgi:hypothetical protein